MSFVHLHVHTKYSLREGVISIDKLVQKAKELGMPALAITDCNNAYGIFSFYKECVAQDIKPIIGCEVYLGTDKYQLVLLVKNQRGYRNYSELLSLTNIQWAHLQKYHEGLICLSGNDAGEVRTLLAENKYAEAKEAASKYKDLFGADYYLEVQEHCRAEQKKSNQQLKEIGKELNIQLVATNDVHYLNKEDAYLQEVFMAHCDHKIISDNDRRKFISDELYFKSSTEMRSVFSETPQLLANTLAIADKISFKFVWQNYLPKISKQDPDQELTELVSKRISLYYQNTELLKAQARAAHELEIIKQLGNAEYFLIVNDYVSWALANNIPRGYGRGSAAGAIVNYVLGITAIDPLAQGLIFERFINPERISLPDIDIDVSLKDRSRVMEYIINRYGEENAAVARSIGADPHASGLALANTNLKNITPLKADPADLLPRTQLALYDLEELGVLKIDIYGLRSLDIVHKCEEYISKNYDNEFRIMNLPFDDQATFKLMQKGATFACFQLESAGARKILRKIKPTTFSDITAIASFLYRAAPFESGIVAQYIARKLGKEKFKLLFPELKPYLAETYGLIIYQEQLMQIAHTIGGFSMSKADILRKAMGKKKADIIAKLREEFVTGAVAKGHNKKASENIYDTCAKFAEYGFNKAHAVSYAALTYTTAYLKANYPTEYMAAVLDNTRMLTPEMEQELCRMGIRLEGYACELLRELVSANTWIKIIPQGTAIIVDYEL